VQKIVRWTTVPTPLGAHTIPPGECLVVLLGAANRDPAVFSEPDRLDIRREEASNLAFGRGIHHCPGFAIARMEAEIAIGALLARTSECRLAVDTVEWQQTTSLRGPARLPLTVAWR
jgi:cytochrome P450